GSHPPSMLIAWLCFFFQAEDGIRDPLVTGVQTCALPISGFSPAGARGCGPPPAFSSRRSPIPLVQENEYEFIYIGVPVPVNPWTMRAVPLKNCLFTLPL